MPCLRRLIEHRSLLFVKGNIQDAAQTHRLLVPKPLPSMLQMLMVASKIKPHHKLYSHRIDLTDMTKRRQS
jgi:hypothetical protein